MIEECSERGELMADVWIGYTTVLETVMARMHSLCLEDRNRYAFLASALPTAAKHDCTQVSMVCACLNTR